MRWCVSPLALTVVSLCLPLAQAQVIDREKLEGVKATLARELEHLRGQQYQQVGSDSWVSIPRAGAQRSSVQLEAGKSYALVAACDQNCSHVRLSIFDPTGSMVMQSPEQASVVIVTGAPVAEGSYAIEVAVPGCATLACHVGFVVSRYESSNHPPPSESSATATPAPERTRLASDHFDGRWVVKWRGSGERPCKLPNGAYSGTYAFVVKNGTASAQLHSGALSGRIAADGSGAWRTLAMTDGAPIRTVGRFIGNNGSGTITRLDGKCTASFTARRVGRSERNAEASAPASSGTFLRSDGAPNCGPHVAGGRYCRNASGQVCYKGLTGSLGRCF